MSARAVDSFRGTFSGTGGSFSDPGVALDEILSLTGNVEPVVLRVSAAGLDDASGGSLAGDWLCVDHEPPRRMGVQLLVAQVVRA